MATVAELLVAISAETSGLVRGLGDAQSRFKKFGDELQGVGAKMTIGITAPLALMGAAILKVGMDYEKAMNLFQVNARATGDEMARAGQLARQLGADMQLPATSAGDAALAMNELAKGGLTASEAMDAVKGTLQLAAAAGISEAEAALMTATALNVFGLAAGESARVTDLLAAAANASLAEINDIGLAMSQAANVFANSKVSVEDLTTSIALMAQAGIKGSDAGTSLKTMMIALTAPTDKAAATMKQLGINIFDAQGNIVSFRGMIEQVTGALKGMSDEQQAAAMKTIFGNDAIRAGNEIMAKGVKHFDEMSKAVNRSGVAQEVAEARAKGLSGAIDGLVSQLETLGLVIFQAVGPALESVVRMLADLVGNLGEADKAVIQAGVTMAAVFAAAGPIVVGIGLVISLIGGPLTLAVLGLTAAVAVLAGEWVLDMNDMNKSSAITAEDVKKKFIDMAVTIGHVLDAISFAANLIVATIKAIGLTMLAVTRPILTVIFILEDGVKAGLKRMDDAWINMNQSFNASTSAMASAVEGRWSNMLGNLVRGMANAQQQIVRGWGETERSFQARSRINWDATGRPVVPIVRPPVLTGGGGGGGGGGGSLKKDLDTAYNDVQKWVQAVGNQLEISKQTWDSLAKGVQADLSAMARAYHANHVDVDRWGAILAATFNKVGLEVKKLANGHLLIRDSSIQLVSHVEGVAQSMDKMIIPMSHVDALAIKMKDTFLDLAPAAAGVSRQLLDDFSAMGNRIPQSINHIIDSIIAAQGPLTDSLLKMGLKVKGVFADVFQVIGNLPGKIGEALRKGASEIERWVQTINGVLGLLNKIFSSIPASLGDAISKVVSMLKGGNSSLTGVLTSTASTARTSASTVVDSWTKGTSALSAGLGVAAGAFANLTAAMAVTAATGSRTLGVLSALATGALSVAMMGPLGFIPAAIGVLGALFGGGGKSAAQKQQEKAAAEQAKVSMQQAAQAVIDAAITGFDKALSFFERLDEFTAPRKAKFQKFFAAFSKLMDYFLELSRKWAADSLTKAKAAAEAIGPIADAISKLPDAFNAISGHFGIAESALVQFFADFDRVMTAFFTRADVWIDGQSKRAMKVANRLNPVVTLISGFAGSLTAISDIKEPTDEMFAIFDRVIDKIVTHVNALSGKFDKAVLKSMANFAEKAGAALSLWGTAIQAIKDTVDIKQISDVDADNVVAGIELFIGKLGASLERMANTDLTRIVAFAQTILPIAGAIKAWADTSAAVRGYTVIAAEAWEAIVTDFNKAIQLMGVLITQAMLFESMAITLETHLKSGAQHLADGIAAMATGVLNTAAALQSAFGHIQGGMSTTSMGGGFGAMSLQTSGGGGITVGQININGSNLSPTQLEDAVINALVKAGKRGRF